MKNRNVFVLSSVFGTLVLFLFAVSLFYCSTPVSGAGLPVPGESGGEQEQEKEENWQELQEDLARFLDKRKDVLKLYTGFKIAASAALEGHKSGEKNLFQLDIGGAVSKTLYPGEFRFETLTKLVFQDDTSQENVNLLKMSYEHYLVSWLETYGFIERFADSFLSIRNRYEFGGGFKAEFNFLSNGAKPGKRRENYPAVIQTYSDYIGRIEDLAGRREDIDTGAWLTRLEQLKRKEKMNADVMKREQSLLTFGMALSVFYELEYPETTPGYPARWSNLTRISLRPSLKLRPMEGITLAGYFYFKYPLFKPYRDEEGRVDYRTDLLLRGSLDLAHDMSWAKNAALIFEFQRHFDNAPPIIDRDITGAGIFARDTHNEFKIRLEFGF